MIVFDVTLHMKNKHVRNMFITGCCHDLVREAETHVGKEIEIDDEEKNIDTEREVNSEASKYF